MADKSEPNKSSSRWWEYYVIRYFAATVVGGLILTQAGAKYPKFSLVLDTSSSLEALAKNFTLLAALSFAYCYIASAPMLTLHAARAILGAGMTSLIKNPRRAVGFSSIPSFALAAFFVFLVIHQKSPPFRWLYLTGFFLVSLIQAQTICVALCTERATIIQFYKDLTETRARKSPKGKEYVESYRHLREHGNAYGIILLELALAPAMAWNYEPKWVMAVLVIWLLPAAFCWIVATMLESALVLSPADFPVEEVKKTE